MNLELQRKACIALGLLPSLNLAARHRLLSECLADSARLDAMDFSAALRELETTAAIGAEVVTWVDDDYPPAFRTLPDPPIFFEVLGKSWRDTLAIPKRISVVGSRECSAYGAMVTESLVRPLALAQCVIVSGGARGIDAVAHRTCLSVGGRTVVVLGSGLAKPYPAHHRELFRRAAESGCVISEFRCEESARNYHFPLRNRLVAALGQGVLVTEAGTRSGSLITARQALEQGKEVMAVPGALNSETARGCNRLLQEGAFLVQTAADVGLVMNWSLGASEAGPGLNAIEAQILREMGELPVTRQSIINMTRLPHAEVAKSLMDLQDKGCICELPGERWMRSLQGSETLWQKQ